MFSEYLASGIPPGPMIRVFPLPRLFNLPFITQDKFRIGCPITWVPGWRRCPHPCPWAEVTLLLASWGGIRVNTRAIRGIRRRNE